MVYTVRLLVCVGLAATLLVGICGCGMIADKDRIKIAKFMDVDHSTGQSYERYITRGELSKVIREMSDEERPAISNKGDLLRVLNGYINDQIRAQLAKEVRAEAEAQGVTLLTRDEARQLYFAKHAEGNYEAIYNLTNPEAIGMTPEEHETQKALMDVGIDGEYVRLLSGRAVEFRAVKDYEAGLLQITDEDYEQEFKYRKDELKTLEWIEFRAIRFPVTMPDATGQAAKARQLVQERGSFDEVCEEYRQRSQDFVFESEIENNPGLERFQNFWRTASGCQEGDVLGPVYMPEHSMQAIVEGRAVMLKVPAAYLVLKVLGHREVTQMTLDDAKQVMAPGILVGKEMAKLRQDRQVEIFEDKLPDPEMFSRKSSDGKVQF